MIQISLYNFDDSDILKMLFSDTKFEYYYESLVESAMLLSKFYGSLARLDLPYLLIELCMNVFQCNGALLIISTVVRPKENNDACSDIINRIHKNMQFVTYRALYAHLPLIVQEFEKIQGKILLKASCPTIGAALKHVHEYLDIGIGSIMGKDVDNTREDAENMDGNICPIYINSQNTANMSDIQILNNIFNKFAI